MAEFDFSKKVGPLPLGVWIVVIAGGLGIGWYFSKSTAKAGGSSEEQVPLTEPGVGAGGQQFIYEPPVTVETPDDEPMTNIQWGIKAQSYLIAQGYDPGIAISAITKFLSGLNRTSQEQALVNIAVQKLGVPPEEVPLPEKPAPTVPPIAPPPQPTPKPPTKPTPTAPKPPARISYSVYTVRKGDTPSKILKNYPGRSWWHVYTTNDRVGLRPDGSMGVMAHPQDLKPGIKLLIPYSSDPKRLGTIPVPKTGYSYYTVPPGITSLTWVANKLKVHPWNLYTANDVVGKRPDGSPGILLAFSVRPGQRLVVPKQ